MTPTPTPQQIIELAREAGFALGFSSPALEKHQRFATLLLERFGQAPSVQQEPVATVTASAYDRLQALVDSQAERIIELEERAPVAQEPVAVRHRKTGQLESAAAFAEPYDWGDRSEWEFLYTHPAPAEVREPLTDAQIEAGRQRVFSTNNPFCPCDSKTMRKAVQWAERAHGITGDESFKLK